MAMARTLFQPAKASRLVESTKLRNSKKLRSTMWTRRIVVNQLNIDSSWNRVFRLSMDVESKSNFLKSSQ